MLSDGESRVRARSCAGPGVTAGAKHGAEHVRDLARLALGHVVTDPRTGQAPNENLAQALRAPCDAARAQGLQAEELLVIVKDSWRHLGAKPSLDRFEADAA